MAKRRVDRRGKEILTRTLDGGDGEKTCVTQWRIQSTSLIKSVVIARKILKLKMAALESQRSKH